MFFYSDNSTLESGGIYETDGRQPARLLALLNQEPDANRRHMIGAMLCAGPALFQMGMAAVRATPGPEQEAALHGLMQELHRLEILGWH